jgi:hypothetical protein
MDPTRKMILSVRVRNFKETPKKASFITHRTAYARHVSYARIQDELFTHAFKPGAGYAPKVVVKKQARKSGGCG